MKEDMPIAGISSTLDILRSTIYNRKRDRINGTRKPHIAEGVESNIKGLSGKRTTYGYRKICTLLRSSGIHVNIKTVRRVTRRNNLSFHMQSIRTTQGRSI
ncbi:hypothetical protein Thermo_01088 [Thermoplasmatales archaeon]|nr:hypothetical protein Thermo_01088 [Thermoplasmatales archaeon]